MKLLRSVLIFVIFFLTSCLPLRALDTRVTFRADENWEARVELVFEPSQAQLAASQIEESLNEYVGQRRAEGIEVEWVRQAPDAEGNTPYLISARGQGLDKLNSAFFNNQAELHTDQEASHIVFRYVPDRAQLVGVEQTFTLVGGRVISANGLQTGDGTVVWSNPAQPVEAVLTPLPPYPWLPYTLISVGAVLLVVAALGIARNLRARSVPVSSKVDSTQETMPGGSIQPVTDRGIPLAPAAPSVTPQPAPMAQLYCHKCGHALELEASFCPQCGSPRRA